MKNRSPLPLLISGILVVALLITLLAKGGWLVWIPTLAALAVVFGIPRRPSADAKRQSANRKRTHRS